MIKKKKKKKGMRKCLKVVRFLRVRPTASAAESEGIPHA
jgi:hypothetical protein